MSSVSSDLRKISVDALWKRTHESSFFFFFFKAEAGIRVLPVTGVQTCALPIPPPSPPDARRAPAKRGRASIPGEAGARLDTATGSPQCMWVGRGMSSQTRQNASISGGVRSDTLMYFGMDGIGGGIRILLALERTTACSAGPPVFSMTKFACESMTRSMRAFAWL